MFFIGTSAPLIPYLLLSLATLVCYIHKHCEAEPSQVLFSHSQSKEIRIPLAKQDVLYDAAREAEVKAEPQPIVNQSETESANISDYSSYKLEKTKRKHLLRAPPVHLCRIAY